MFYIAFIPRFQLQAYRHFSQNSRSSSSIYYCYSDPQENNKGVNVPQYGFVHRGQYCAILVHYTGIVVFN